MKYNIPAFKKLISLLASVILIFIGNSGAITPKPCDNSQVRVMSFNVRCVADDFKTSITKRAPLIAQIINEYEPETCGVQEAHMLWMSQLNARLPDYDFVGVGRQDGNLLGEFSAIFYNTKKVKVIESGTFWLSQTPEKPSKGWDAKQRRIATWAILERLSTGEQYVHLNTHFDHKGKEARAESVRMIVEKAKSFNMPVIVSGDFNLAEGSELYQGLTDAETSVLRDAKFTAEDSMNSITFHAYDPESRDPETSVIDFIFTNDMVKPCVYRVFNQTINGLFPSDHYPIYADVELLK